MQFYLDYEHVIKRIVLYFVALLIINAPFKNRKKLYISGIATMIFILAIKVIGRKIQLGNKISEIFFWDIYPFITMILYTALIYNPIMFVYSLIKTWPLIIRIIIIGAILCGLAFLWLFFFGYFGGVYLYWAPGR